VIPALAFAMGRDAVHDVRIGKFRLISSGQAGVAWRVHPGERLKVGRFGLYTGWITVQRFCGKHLMASNGRFFPAELRSNLKISSRSRCPGHPLILKENGIPGTPLFSYIPRTRPPERHSWIEKWTGDHKAECIPLVRRVNLMRASLVDIVETMPKVVERVGEKCRSGEKRSPGRALRQAG